MLLPSAGAEQAAGAKGGAQRPFDMPKNTSVTAATGEHQQLECIPRWCGPEHRSSPVLSCPVRDYALVSPRLQWRAGAINCSTACALAII